jgi:hypothetical protein
MNSTYAQHPQTSAPPATASAGFNYQPPLGFNPPPSPGAAGQYGTGQNPLPPGETGFPVGAAGAPGPGKKPLPLLKQGGADVTLRVVAITEIRFLPEATHRASISSDRVKVLMNRIRKLEHLPPVMLWQAPNGDLVLLDGWHRLEAFRLLGVQRVSAIVISEPLEKALVLAISGNIPGNGKMRADNDAVRALCVLATALGRPLEAAEATSLGLEFTAHEVVNPVVMKTWPVPALSPIRAPGEQHVPKRLEASTAARKKTGTKGGGTVRAKLTK